MPPNLFAAIIELNQTKSSQFTLLATRLAIVGRAHRLATRAFVQPPIPRRSAAASRPYGAEVIGRLTYYERWIVAFANILFRKGILAPTELAVKIREVEARRPDDR